MTCLLLSLGGVVVGGAVVFVVLAMAKPRLPWW